MLARYLQYLHQDIRQAMRRPEEFPPAPGPGRFSGEPLHFRIDEAHTTFGERCGLIPEAFPPADRLSPNQLERLCIAMKALYRSWRLDLLLPEALPAEAVYPVLVGVLERKLPLVTRGWVVVDFCEQGGCPFGKHCFCREEEMDNPFPGFNIDPEEGEWY